MHCSFDKPHRRRRFISIVYKFSLGHDERVKGEQTTTKMVENKESAQELALPNMEKKRIQSEPEKSVNTQKRWRNELLTC